MWQERLHGLSYSDCRVSVDGTDFRILEPEPFDRKWFSHKFKTAGLRYEVAICIRTGMMVWVNGPFAAGSWPDLRIFKAHLLPNLLSGEKVIADRGYRHVSCVYTFGENDIFCARVRARHETCNRRLKEFGVLSQRFRHRLTRHVDCFYAVANAVHVSMTTGETSLFPCNVLFASS